MIEQEWRVCCDPARMMEFIVGDTYDKVASSTADARPGQVSDRKLRLYACGCFERYGDYSFHPLTCTALEVAERFADGQATEAELNKVNTEANEALSAAVKAYEADFPSPPTKEEMNTVEGARKAVLHRLKMHYLCVGAYATCPSVGLLAIACHHICPVTPTNLICDDERLLAQARWEDTVAHAALLRDVVGYAPYRSISIGAAERSSSVTSLARHIYEAKAFDQMPALARALEEAGCTNKKLIAHCRSRKPHIRGCWALDLILGLN